MIDDGAAICLVLQITQKPFRFSFQNNHDEKNILSFSHSGIYVLYGTGTAGYKITYPAGQKCRQSGISF